MENQKGKDENTINLILKINKDITITTITGLVYCIGVCIFFLKIKPSLLGYDNTESLLGSIVTQVIPINILLLWIHIELAWKLHKIKKRMVDVN